MSLLEVTEARRRADLARARLSEDIAVLRERTRPATLIADVRSRAVAAVSGRPAVAAGAVAALVAFAALSPVRRASLKIMHFAWRNRAALGLLLGTRLNGAPAADPRKDHIQ